MWFPLSIDDWGPPNATLTLQICLQIPGCPLAHPPDRSGCLEAGGIAAPHKTHCRDAEQPSQEVFVHRTNIWLPGAGKNPNTR